MVESYLSLLLSTAYTTWGVPGRKRRLSAARRNAWAGGMLYRDSVSLTPLIQVSRGASSCFEAIKSCVTCHISDLKNGAPVATLPGAWCYRVSAGTGRTGVCNM